MWVYSTEGNMYRTKIDSISDMDKQQLHSITIFTRYLKWFKTAKNVAHFQKKSNITKYASKAFILKIYFKLKYILY